MPKSKASKALAPSQVVHAAQSNSATHSTKPHAFAAVVEGLPALANTRDRILHAAVSLLYEEGFASLTQQRVCERAGVRQSHLTYYFPTRNDLLRETAVFGCGAMLESMAESVRAGPMSVQQIRDELLTVDEADRKFGRLMVALIAASDEDTRIKPWLASFETENRERIRALLRAAGAEIAIEDVELLHAAYVGAVMLDIGESSEESLARARSIVQRAFDAVVRVSSPSQTRRPTSQTLATRASAASDTGALPRSHTRTTGSKAAAAPKSVRKSPRTTKTSR
jgi:AcrR family transcriptional regulator